MASQRSEIQLSTPQPDENGHYGGPHKWDLVIDTLPPFSAGQAFIERAARRPVDARRRINRIPVNVDLYAERLYAGGLIERVRRWGIPGIFNRYLSRVILSTSLEVPSDDARHAVLPSRVDDAASRAALVGAFLRLDALTASDLNYALPATAPEGHVVNPPPFNQVTQSW